VAYQAPAPSCIAPCSSPRDAILLVNSRARVRSVPRRFAYVRSRDCERSRAVLTSPAPDKSCDWHQGGKIVWPAEYVEWAEQNGAANETAVDKAAAGKAAGAQFQIVSPRAGDRYEIPPGIDRRYATIAFRAASTPAQTGRALVCRRPPSLPTPLGANPRIAPHSSSRRLGRQR